MILLIDNYDSFTYNIAHALGALGCELMVRRNDALAVEAVADWPVEAIVISPGPGRPENAGITCALIERYADQIPILGVCLGHQAIALVFGAQVVRAAAPVHGKCSEIFHHGQGIFRGMRNPFRATRYHSLVVPEASVKPPLAVSAYTLEGEVMGLYSPDLEVVGVQFHPESVATDQGRRIFENFLSEHLPPVRGECGPELLPAASIRGQGEGHGHRHAPQLPQG
jgi:anthranilate synthase/aminodeoxychorismate synthase-like glutamine amidotransferase